MYFDFFLLSVIMMTAYLGPVIVRRQPPGRRAFGWLLMADGACAVISLVARHTGSSEEPSAGADLLGFVAIGAAVFLVMVPPVLRGLARRAVMADRLGLARRLIGLREHLQPGMGAERELELLEALTAVREGKVDDAVAVLEEARRAIDDPVARRRIDERMVLTYLAARRWQAAIELFESSLGGEQVSPQLAVEMVRAYAEAGDVVAAAGLVTRIEALPVAEEPALGFLLYRARLVFLAYAGRVAAVDAIVAARGPLGALPPAVRAFWSGMARLRAGDGEGAREHLDRAVRHSRRDRHAREYAERVRASLEQPGVVGPHALGPELEALADRLAGAVLAGEPEMPRAVPPQGGVSWRRVPVTTMLIAANVAMFVAVFALYGSTGDPGGLVRAGANVKSAVLAGEWWRLMSSTFLHVGILHLVLNMSVLWILGKLVELIYGPVRMFGLYASAGVMGSLASVLVGGQGISAGASGAVMGILGALIAELGLRRKAYPERWRKLLFGNLVFFAVAQVGIGFFYSAIDQSAHVGGLLTGALVAAVMSPEPRSRAAALAGRGLALILGLGGAAMVVYGGVGVATVSYGKTLSRFGEVEHRVADVLAFTGPSSWSAIDVGHFRDDVVEVVLEARPRGGLELAQHLALQLRDENLPDDGSRMSMRGNALAAPEPWQSSEILFRHDGMGGEQVYRISVFGREVGSEVWLVSVVVPEVLAEDMQPVVTRLLSSMHRL